MLPDMLFHPLDLDDAIADVRRVYGAAGVVDLLVVCLTDRRVRTDAEIDRYLDELKSACRQTRRYRDAIAVLERVAALNPARHHEVAAELSLVYAHLGEPARGAALLRLAHAQQRRLPSWQRSAAFCLVGELAATMLGLPAIARDLAVMSRTAGIRVAPNSGSKVSLEEIELLALESPEPTGRRVQHNTIESLGAGVERARAASRRQPRLAVARLAA